MPVSKHNRKGKKRPRKTHNFSDKREMITLPLDEFEEIVHEAAMELCEDATGDCRYWERWQDKEEEDENNIGDPETNRTHHLITPKPWDKESKLVIKPGEYFFNLKNSGKTGNIVITVQPGAIIKPTTDFTFIDCEDTCTHWDYLVKDLPDNFIWPGMKDKKEG